MCTTKRLAMPTRKSIALRQIGPKCAFFTNRTHEAFENNPIRQLKRKKPERSSPLRWAVVPQPASFTEFPAFRSLACATTKQLECRRVIDFSSIDDEDDGAAIAVKNLVPSLDDAHDAPVDEETQRRCNESLDASLRLDRTIVVDEMREAIADDLRRMHSGAPCTYRQLMCAVFLMLTQRGIPKKVRRELAADRYRVFDVKMLYYGDFVGKIVHVVENGLRCIKTGTVVAYHPFDGFVAERLVDGTSEKFVVAHDTEWVWDADPKTNSG